MALNEFDLDMLEAVQDLIPENGIDVSFQVGDTYAYNPTTGAASFGTLSSVTARAAPLSSERYEYPGSDSVEIGESQLFVDPTTFSDPSFVPKPGLKVTAGGRDWRSVAATPLRTANAIPIWILELST